MFHTAVRFLWNDKNNNFLFLNTSGHHYLKIFWNFTTVPSTWLGQVVEYPLDCSSNGRWAKDERLDGRSGRAMSWSVVQSIFRPLSTVNSPHGLALKLSPQNPSASPVLEVALLPPIGNFSTENFRIGSSLWELFYHHSSIGNFSIENLLCECGTLS